MKRVMGGLIAVLIAAGCGSAGTKVSTSPGTTIAKKPPSVAEYCARVKDLNRQRDAAAYDSTPETFLALVAGFDEIVPLVPDEEHADAQTVAKVLHVVGDAVKNSGGVSTAQTAAAVSAVTSAPQNKAAEKRLNAFTKKNCHIDLGVDDTQSLDSSESSASASASTSDVVGVDIPKLMDAFAADPALLNVDEIGVGQTHAAPTEWTIAITAKNFNAITAVQACRDAEPFVFSRVEHGEITVANDGQAPMVKALSAGGCALVG